MKNAHVVTMPAVDKVTVGAIKLGVLYNLLPTMLWVDPKSNARFSVPHDLQDLLNDVKQKGVIQNVEARLLTPEEQKEHPGKLGKLRLGFNRAAVVEALNEVKGAEVKYVLPVKFVDASDDNEGLERNIAENIRRFEMSTMDMSIAIDKLLQAGRSEQYIRKLLAPQGRKEMSPVRFQQYRRLTNLERKYQILIHDGVIPREIALSSTALGTAQQQKAFDRAIEDREKRLAAEKASEDRWLELEREKEQKAAVAGQPRPKPSPRPGMTESGRVSRAKKSEDIPMTVAEFNKTVRDSGIAAQAGKFIPLGIGDVREDLKALAQPAGTRLAAVAKAFLTRLDGKCSVDALRTALQEALMETAPVKAEAPKEAPKKADSKGKAKSGKAAA